MAEPSLIVYDGDCIFCQNYVRFTRLRESVGTVELLDARSDDPRVAKYWRSGYDLNEGMLFVHNGQIYHGADSVHVLATLSGGSSMLNRLNARIFASPRTANALYPLLKLGRRVTLMLRGKSLLNDELLRS